MEVQFLHFNTNYGSFKEALEAENGILGMAVLFQVCDILLYRSAYSD